MAGASPTPDPDQWAESETWIVEAVPEPEEVTDQTRGRSSGPRDLATGRGVAAPGSTGGTPPSGCRRIAAGGRKSARTEGLTQRLADAAYAYEKERYQDARRILRSLVDEIPDSPAVRELFGLTLYRTSQWSAAAVDSSKCFTASVDHSTSTRRSPIAIERSRRFGGAERVWKCPRAGTFGRPHHRPTWSPRARSWPPDAWRIRTTYRGCAPRGGGPEESLDLRTATSASGMRWQTSTSEWRCAESAVSFSRGGGTGS